MNRAVHFCSHEDFFCVAQKRDPKMASVSGTLDVHKEVHNAQDTEATMKIAYNKDGSCGNHPSVKMKEKKSMFSGGGWKTLMDKCPMCEEEHALKMRQQEAKLVMEIEEKRLKAEEHAAKHAMEMKKERLKAEEHAAKHAMDMEKERVDLELKKKFAQV